MPFLAMGVAQEEVAMTTGAGASGPSRSSRSALLPVLQLSLLLSLVALLVAAPIVLHLRGILLLSPSPSPSCLHTSPSYSSPSATALSPLSYSGDLRDLPFSWNLLSFPPSAPAAGAGAVAAPLPFLLRIALFVKKWPLSSSPGGLERHALTLHRFLVDRGHYVDIFTTDGTAGEVREFTEDGFHFHIFPPSPNGKFDWAPAWERFVQMNASLPFDIIHSESVALPPHRAILQTNVVVSWHGIAYEIIQSDIVRDLTRKPGEERPHELHKALSERTHRVVEEVKFFPAYAHHVATSDYVGDVLHTVYQIPVENIHVILNGVDQQRFKPNAGRGLSFRGSHGIPAQAKLVLGAAGRLVKDKGYPLLFEAFTQVLSEHKDIYLMIAGDGPWASRFRTLAPNAVVLGPLSASDLADFYNAIDIFINPTLRSQGLDHTLLEAMLCGKPLMATHFSSITRSIITGKDVGYTFSPNVAALLEALQHVIQDGQQAWEQKGKLCYKRASLLFTATKMGSAYERLFLCIKDNTQCMYPLPHDG